jgi:hypothetical protein
LRWPKLLDFWGLPNLQIINRDIHIAKSADEAAYRHAGSGSGAPALTQSKAAEQCWMETEHGNKSLPLEKRAKIVDQCVKDKMSGAK